MTARSEAALQAEKGENPDDVSDDIGKDEMNLAEFPFAVLSKRVAEGQKTIEVNQEGRDASGRIIRQEWIVTGSDKFGLPVAADDGVYVALMKLLRDDRFSSRTVRFTVIQLLRIMRSGSSKRDYERVEQALDRLTGVLLRSKNAFWDHTGKRHVTEAFHLLDSYRLVRGANSRERSEVTFSEFLFSSMRSGYVKNLDIEFYFSLSTPLARRYYRLLDKHRHRGRTYEVDILRLAQKLPLQDAYLSQLRRRLDPIHAEFIERGFLEGADYREGVDGTTVVCLRFASSRIVEQPMRELLATPSSPAVSAGPVEKKLPDPPSVETRLIAAGVSRKVAADLVRDHAPEEVDRQLSYLPYVEGLKNPGGYLRLAIEHGYGPPPAWIKAQRQQKPRSRPREPQSVPEAVESLDPWESLCERDQAEWLERATADLRASCTLWSGNKRIPTPILMAHARFLQRRSLQ